MQKTLLEVWKTIRVGTPGFKTADDFRNALNRANCHISDRTNAMLDKLAFIASKIETEIDLVVASVAEFGFRVATCRDIFNRAQELGLGLCPAEAGPQLRLQYMDQPRGEWLLVGMEPITDSDGYPSVFSVGRSGSGLWLSGGNGHPDGFWGGNDRWVFARPKELALRPTLHLSFATRANDRCGAFYAILVQCFFHLELNILNGILASCHAP